MNFYKFRLIEKVAPLLITLCLVGLLQMVFMRMKIGGVIALSGVTICLLIIFFGGGSQQKN